MKQPALDEAAQTYAAPEKGGVAEHATDKTALASVASLMEKLPGLLSTVEASPDREIREIRVSMLPLQHQSHLENFADSFGAGWLDPQAKQLRLQFQLVAVFSNAKTEQIWLSVPGKDEKIALSPTRIASPAVGQRHAKHPWAAQSRFVLNEVIDLPDWAISSAKFDLLAGVEGKPQKVGVIYVSEAFKSIDEIDGAGKHTTLPEIPDSASPLVLASANKLLERGADIPLLAGRAIDRIKRMDRLFLFTVVLPTLLATIYFGFIASDVYISESRFVVRSPQHQGSTGFGALLQVAGFSRSQDDAYNVHDYILSRDALKQLDAQFALAKDFSSSKVDIFSRFNSLRLDESFEALYLYFQKHVELDLDSSSSISTLTVRAFSPETAYQINEKLLEMGETLVNQLNERGRQDMVRFASAEVAVAEQRAKAAALAVSHYRDKKGVFDPEGQSSLHLQQASKVEEELIASKIQLAQISNLAKDNPQIPSLRKRIAALQAESNAETAKVVGGDRALSKKSPEYEGLQLELSFAGKQLDVALTSLMQARNDAQRQQLYLERVVQPSRPDVAMEPRRIRNIFATLALGLIAWGILTMLLAGVREHQE